MDWEHLEKGSLEHRELAVQLATLQMMLSELAKNLEVNLPQWTQHLTSLIKEEH